jgi:hypothetical protein
LTPRINEGISEAGFFPQPFLTVSGQAGPGRTETVETIEKPCPSTSPSTASYYEYMKILLNKSLKIY